MIGSTAINLHGIGAPQRTLEPGEAPYWISEAQYAALLQAIAASRLRDRIHITFDDGNLSDLEIGLPGLLEHGLRADFFVLTGRLDQPGSLACADVLALQRAGMGVGSHGVDHLDWSGLSAQALQDEIIRSRDVLAELTGAPVRHAAVPFGRWNGRVLKALGAAGYDRIWTSDGGRFRDGAVLRPRSSVRGDMTPETFERIVAGRMPPLARLRRIAGMTHKYLQR
jgi:peptidoglycan/xylan/chitin deacetylase (PgdA/CDA1 family)